MLSALPPLATGERTFRIGSFVPGAAVSICSKQAYAEGQTYSITSSATESSDCGTVRPSILAVSALMTSSNLVD